jgi:hypothetical protein
MNISHIYDEWFNQKQIIIFLTFFFFFYNSADQLERNIWSPNKHGKNLFRILIDYFLILWSWANFGERLRDKKTLNAASSSALVRTSCDDIIGDRTYSLVPSLSLSLLAFFFCPEIQTINFIDRLASKWDVLSIRRSGCGRGSWTLEGK